MLKELVLPGKKPKAKGKVSEKNGAPKLQFPKQRHMRKGPGKKRTIHGGGPPGLYNTRSDKDDKK